MSDSRHAASDETQSARTDETHARGACSALAFDLDGTIYLGSQLLPGALELLAALTASDVPYLFATNNSSKTVEQYVRHLRSLGIPAAREHVVTSNDVAIDFLRGEGWLRPYLVATPEVTLEYERNGLLPTDGDPDCVLLTFDTTLTYDKLRVATRLIQGGLPYFATHPDRVCPTPDGPIPDCGTFIELLEAPTGRRPQVLGKPERFMAQTISRRLATPPDEIAFVGDRLYTDVRMANEHGFTAILTLTGEARREDARSSAFVPDLIVETLEALHDHLERHGTVAARGARL
jgi:HAD superfamily hydrolase (TIGR01450 family)